MAAEGDCGGEGAVGDGEVLEVCGGWCNESIAVPSSEVHDGVEKSPSHPQGVVTVQSEGRT